MVGRLFWPQRGAAARAAAGLICACALALGAAAAANAASPPPLTILTQGANNDNGDIFISPTGAKAPYSNGVEITNTQGQVIWFHAAPAGDEDTDFRTQTYEGQPVLTFWQGTGFGGLAKGTDYIYNDQFEQIAAVNAGNGLSADGHEFLITPQNTALILAYATNKANLSSIGGSTEQTVVNGYVQEIDISTGQVLFQWDSEGNVPFSASEEALPKSPSIAWEWFHINAVKLDTNGNLLIDARNTWAFYEVNRTSGEVLWTLGGKDSTFTEQAALGQTLNDSGYITAWQHDPEGLGNDEYTVFDNEAAVGPPQLPYSRVVTIQLNQLTDTATLASSYEQPQEKQATSQGNSQTTANGDLFTGWGALPYITESNAADETLWEAEFPTGVNSYRAYRLPWVSGTSVEASANPATTTAGTSVTYSATVSSPASGTPTGTVTFSDGATTLCTAELANGGGSCSASNAPVGNDTITASYSGDSNFASSTGTTALTVDEAPTITSTNSATFTEGSGGSFTPTATGFPSPNISESGQLPGGVTFSGGVLSGTPTQSGTFTITFTASNGVSPEAEQSFTLTVDAAPAFTSASSTTFVKGSKGSFTVTASGFPAPGISESGQLPGGVTFSGGVLSGTPTQSGTFPITFTASNGVSPEASQSFTLTVDAAPTITSANKATFAEGSAGSFTVTATGLPTPGISESGTLPGGVTFSGGVLSGTPTQGGVFPITFTASNGVGSNAVQSFTLTVDAPPLITSAKSTQFEFGTRGSFKVTASGTPSPTLTEWGTLPKGVTFSNGTLSGIPNQVGSFEIAFEATNGIGSPNYQEFLLNVLGLHVTTTSLPEATTGVPYSVQLTAAGGTPPYHWSLAPGGMPAGLKLKKTGVISGKPKATAQSQLIAVKVYDSGSPVQEATATLQLNVL